MSSSFAISEDATATAEGPSDTTTDRSGSQSSPAAPKPEASPVWTTVGRRGKKGPKTASLPAPRLPPSPDPDTTLATLYRDYRREQRRWHTAHQDTAQAFEHLMRHDIPDPQVLPLDTVVCVALGSLSGTMAPPSLLDGKAIVGGHAREVSMKQLVAVEEWIGILRERGHQLPAPGTVSMDEDAENAQNEDSNREKTHGLNDPYTIPSTFPLRGAKIIQDPALNTLDAHFLQRLGWTVLPSTSSACRYTNRQPRAEHAGSHVTRSTLAFAPHAPHSLVRAAFVTASDHPGPGVYIGNRVDDGDVMELEDGEQPWMVKASSRRRQRQGQHQQRGGQGRDKTEDQPQDGEGVDQVVQDEEKEEADELGAPMTPAQREQARRWTAARTLLALGPGSGAFTAKGGWGAGMDVALSDTSIYVLKQKSGADADEGEEAEGGRSTKKE